MSALYLIAAGLAGGVIISVVCLAAVLGWGQMTRFQRWGLIWLAAGLMGAAADRALQRPVGAFDVLMLSGVALYLVATYGAAILRRAVRCDEVADVRIRMPRRP